MRALKVTNRLIGIGVLLFLIAMVALALRDEWTRGGSLDDLDADEIKARVNGG